MSLHELSICLEYSLKLLASDHDYWDIFLSCLTATKLRLYFFVFLVLKQFAVCFFITYRVPQWNFTNLKIRKVWGSNLLPHWSRIMAQINTLIRYQALIKLVFASMRNCELEFPRKSVLLVHLCKPVNKS